jgi:hypothetical protein
VPAPTLPPSRARARGPGTGTEKRALAIPTFEQIAVEHGPHVLDGDEDAIVRLRLAPRGPVAPAGPMSPPALFTRMSIRPSSARIRATAAFTAAGSVRSAATASTRPPVSAATSRATCSSDSPSPKARADVGVVPCTTTAAPSRPSRRARDPRHLPVQWSVVCHLSPFLADEARYQRPAKAGEGQAVGNRVVGDEALAERLGEADFVIVTTPETPDTRGMFNTRLSGKYPGCPDRLV